MFRRFISSIAARRAASLADRVCSIIATPFIRPCGRGSCAREQTLVRFYSYDGGTWTQIGVTTNAPIPTNAIVGLAVAPQNTIAASATFDNLVFLGTPKISAAYNSATLTWQGQAASYAVQVATNQNGPFQIVALGLTATNFTDPNVVSSSTAFYKVSATGPLGGLTVSPVVQVNFPAAPPPPVISGVSLSGANLIITGNNGTAGANYYVLATTNLTVPLTNWTMLSTNQFGPGGSVNFTNPLNPVAPQTYYRLRLP